MAPKAKPAAEAPAKKSEFLVRCRSDIMELNVGQFSQVDWRPQEKTNTLQQVYEVSLSISRRLFPPLTAYLEMNLLGWRSRTPTESIKSGTSFLQRVFHKPSTY